MSRPRIPAAVERRVRADAQQRCGYCLAPQRLVMARLEIDHIFPLSAFNSGDPAANAEENLWLACPICNGHKGDQRFGYDPETGISVPLFNPREQAWFGHFRWTEDGLRIEGITAIGRATVVALHLDRDPDALVVRAYWASVGWHPPRE